jgi:MFS family permease
VEARWLLVGTLFSAIGTGLTLPFLFIYLHEVRGLDPTVVGVVVSWMGVLSLCLSGPWGTLIDRVGARRVVLPLFLVGALGAASWTLVHQPWQAFVSGTLMATAGSAVFGGYNTMLATVTAEDERQRTFGLSFLLLNLGIGTGGVISGVLADVHHASSFRLLYLVDGVSWLIPFVVLSAVPSVGRRIVADSESDAGAGGYRAVFADRAFRRLFTFALLLMGFGYAQLEIGLPAFATEVGHVSTRVIAWAFAANTATIVAGQLLMIDRLRGRSRSRALAVAACIVAAAWVVLGLGAAGHSLGTAVPILGIVLCACVFAVGETVFSPMLPALTNALAPDELRGRYNAASSLVWGLTTIGGPLVAAPLIGHGLGGLWIVIIAAGQLAAAAVALSLRHRLTPEQDGKLTVPVSAEV